MNIDKLILEVLDRKNCVQLYQIALVNLQAAIERRKDLEKNMMFGQFKDEILKDADNVIASSVQIANTSLRLINPFSNPNIQEV